VRRPAGEARGGTALSWWDLLAYVRARIPQPFEARFIVESVAGRLEPVADRRVPAWAAGEVARLAARRAAGEPLQYVLGRWGFRSLELVVDQRVLVPRPETEQLVEVALGELAAVPPDPPPVVADLGTGSGAIALSIAAEAQSVRVWATDASPSALEVAAVNRAALGLADRVRLAAGSWYGALPAELRGSLALVVSNPPYVAEAEVACLPPEVREWEPRAALVAGPTGLEAVAQVVAGAPTWLKAGGAVVVELAPQLARASLALARSWGLARAEVREDLAGRERVLVARAPG
jgi:release factor glutamine methyltransferase